jgi:hypothetical protein
MTTITIKMESVDGLTVSTWLFRLDIPGHEAPDGLRAVLWQYSVGSRPSRRHTKLTYSERVAFGRRSTRDKASGGAFDTWDWWGHADGWEYGDYRSCRPALPPGPPPAHVIAELEARLRPIVSVASHPGVK